MPMKQFLLLTLFFLPLFSLTIEFNSAKEAGLPYGVLHIKDSEPFSCSSVDLKLEQKQYICKFENKNSVMIGPKDTPLVGIEFFQQKDGFEVIISPKFKSKIINMDISLHAFSEVPLESFKDAKHYAILIYEKLPYSESSTKGGINFPIYFPKYKRPDVGALDLNGAPIGYVRSKDINAYLSIKREYEAKRYETILEDVKDTMMLYPQTIFKSELALYRIRAMDRLLDGDEDSLSLAIDRNDIINEGKAWMKTFPADEFMPEVLFYIAKNYMKMGFASDANYFLDILITEHPQNSFTKMGILLYGDSLYGGSKKAEALKLYSDVLYSAKDLDVASEAAIRLAKNSLDAGQSDEAKEYLMKILNANRDFLFQDENEAYELAKKLAQNGLEDIASQIGEALLNSISRSNSNYEEILKDSGLWHGSAKNIAKADELLNRYQKEFASGEFAQEVQEGIDRLFFEIAETDTDKLENYYDTLISRYDNEISQKATVEKAKLYLEKEQFVNVLSLDEAIAKLSDEALKIEGESILKEAAIKSADIALSQDNCQEATILIERYMIKDSLKDRDKVFECLMRLSRYDAAIDEAKNHLSLRDLREKLSWMIRLADAFKKAHKWEDLLKISKEIYDLGILTKKPETKVILRDEFLAYLKLKDYEKALSSARKVREELKGDFANIEVYMEVAKLAKEQGSHLLMKEYTSYALKLQEEKNSFIYSPILDYYAIEAQEKLGDLEGALAVAREIPKKVEELNEKSRAYYYIGELEYKLKEFNLAKESFGRCASIKDDNPWKKMCEEYLNLIK